MMAQAYCPSPMDCEVVPMVTPGHLGGEASLLQCEWTIELVGGAGARKVLPQIMHIRMPVHSDPPRSI